MEKFTFVTPPRLIMEWEGATNGGLAEEAKRLGSRPLIVAGSSLEKNGALDAIRVTLEKAGLTPSIHTGVPPEPNLDALQAAMNAAEGCDSVIAVGGGSVLDVAKGAAALAGTGYSAREYHRGKAPVPEAILRPILAAPTTAGTGSEATWVGVYTDKEQGRKASIRGGSMMPSIAFLDAALTVSCPPRVTAYSGMDAFVQAVEAYTSLGANPLTDSLALDAARMIGIDIINAYKEPGNQEAREALLLGSYMAGVALNTSRLGLVHGLAHPIGAITGAAHGLICGLLMPTVMRFNQEAAYEKYYHVGNAFYQRFFDDFDTKNDQVSDLIRIIEGLLDEMNIPRRLSDIGLREEHLGVVAKESMVSGSTKANPRPVTEADAREVMLSCL